MLLKIVIEFIKSIQKEYNNKHYHIHLINYWKHILHKYHLLTFYTQSFYIYWFISIQTYIFSIFKFIIINMTKHLEDLKDKQEILSQEDQIGTPK